MDSDREQLSFWNFSDQLRLHSANLVDLSIGDLSIGDSIWSDNFPARKLQEERRNMDGGAAAKSSPGIIGPADLNSGWKMGFSAGGGSQKLAFANNHFDRYNSNSSNIKDVNFDNNNNSSSGGSMKTGMYSNNFSNNINNNIINNSSNGMIKNYYSKSSGKMAIGNNHRRNMNINNDVGIGGKKKNLNGNNSIHGNNNSNSNGGGGNGAAVDKRFKTLPPSESLPRSEMVGGYIFVCNNDTMQENLRRQLFGLPPRYRDSVRAITPGLPLFLYNYSTHQLHGIFEAASFGGTNIDPSAWEDKKCPGESRFPAQVRVMTRKVCEPMEEDSFRPILHHYDGPKFRLELSVPEALALLDIFAENDA